MAKESSSERLARALEAKNDPRLNGLIVRARQGKFEKDLSPYHYPMSALVDELLALEHRDLVMRVVQGEFDTIRSETT